MTKPQVVTTYFIFVFTTLAIIYDIAAFVNGGVEATISWTIWSLSKEYPFLPFSFGLLCGHLFGQMIFDKAIGKVNQ